MKLSFFSKQFQIQLNIVSRTVFLAVLKTPSAKNPSFKRNKKWVGIAISFSYADSVSKAITA
jgi:hypothetical protein